MCDYLNQAMCWSILNWSIRGQADVPLSLHDLQTFIWLIVLIVLW